MKKTLLLIAVAALAACKNTKQAVATDHSDPIKYANTITAAELREHLFVVAADEMEGRQTGYEGQ